MKHRFRGLAPLLLCSAVGALPATKASAQTGQPAGRIRAAAILAAQDLTSVQLVRSFIQSRGGRVRGVIGLYGLIADLEPSTEADLAQLPEVAGVYRQAVNPGSFRDPHAALVAEVWNRLLQGAPPAAPYPGPGPATDEEESTDLALTDAERELAQEAYRVEWQQVQASLPREFEAPGCHQNGAGFYDTSLYFAGDIAVGVFYTPGTLGGYTPAMTASTFADVVFALDYFVDLQPEGQITFVYQNEVDFLGNPLAPPPTTTAERTYDNNLRNMYCTDWAYLIIVQNGGMWPNANLHGPSMRTSRDWGWFHYSVQHETGHIFGARDQYVGSGHTCTALFGYLEVVHANTWNTNANCYFGAGEARDDLMAGWVYNNLVGPFTAGQFGWHDSNGNGVLDVQHTFPDVVAGSVAHTSGNPVSYTGTAIDRPLLNELTSPSYTDVSVNSITAVHYRINGGGAWIAAAPGDGIFDSNSETFDFTLPALPNGTYTVDIRATNSVGHVENSIYTEQLVISGSLTTNTRPFATLAVSPLRAQAGTLVTADAAGSFDLETPTPGLTYSWDVGNGFGFGPWSTNSVLTVAYPTPGIYWVQVRVRDAGGVFHVVAQQVIVESYDVAPTAAFTTAWENRHFSSTVTYGVVVNANGVRDGETATSALQVQWDGDDDGNWDFPGWTTSKIKNVVLTNSAHPRSERRRIRMQVKDAASNISETHRFIWIVPYNHRPTLPMISPVTFVPVGADYTMTVNAGDPDFLTTWDGYLQYRYDYDNDGTFDTEFTGTSSFLLPGQYRWTVRVDVRDRFHARAGWVNPIPIEVR